MPKSVSTRSAYKMLTCIYLCRTLLFFAPYADFLLKNTLYGLSFYIYPHLITVINAPISSARALYTLIKINEFILFFNLFTLSLQ